MKLSTAKRLSLVGAALVLGAGTAQAQFSPEDFYAEGVVELEYLDGAFGTSDTGLYGNVDLGFNSVNAIGGLPFGLHLGIEGLHYNDETDFAFYPTISFHPHFGQISVGIPRSVLDGFLDAPKIAGIRAGDVYFGPFLGSSSVRSIYLLGGDTPYGVRYDGAFDGWQIGGSYHRVDDLNVLAAAVKFLIAQPGSVFGNTSLNAAVEIVDGSGVSATNVHLGADTWVDRFNFGLQYSSVEFLADASTIHGYVGFSPLPGLQLTGSILRISPSGVSSETGFGVSAEYTFYQGLYGQIGFFDSDFTGDVLDLSIGWRF